MNLSVVFIDVFPAPNTVSGTWWILKKYMLTKEINEKKKK